MEDQYLQRSPGKTLGVTILDPTQQYLLVEDRAEILKIVQALQDEQRIRLLSIMNGQKSLQYLIQDVEGISFRMGYYHISQLIDLRLIECEYIYKGPGAIAYEIIPRVVHTNILLRLSDKLSPRCQTRLIRVEPKMECYLLNTPASIRDISSALANYKRLLILENLRTDALVDVSELAARVQLPRKQLLYHLEFLKKLPFVTFQQGNQLSLLRKNLWIQLAPLMDIQYRENLPLTT